MSYSLLAKLRAVLKTLDDDALAALANKGLLRRALKDLETSRPELVDMDADVVRIRIGDETVAVPQIPAHSTCSCPATGICRHILGALVYLRDDPSLATTDPLAQKTFFNDQAPNAESSAEESQIAPPIDLPSPEEALGNLSDKELQKWAGKSLFQRAVKLLADHLETELDAGPPLVIRLPSRNISCRWIPGGGVEGLICSCRSESVCEHVVAAVLAYQVFLGRRQIAAAEQMLEASSGTPRSRAEVIDSVGMVLRELIALGLPRLSTATVGRLTTLAVSAHGVDLPRLERDLKSLAEEIQLSLRRDAQSNSANLLLAAARCEALRTGLMYKPTAPLVGQHRTQYQEVGQITLVGLGAQHWQSKGGYRGITVYFWDESRRNFATWSDSRPIDQLHFDPVARFQSDGPWNGCSSPREASCNVLRLTGAFRNAHGRISGRPSTSALVLKPTSMENMPQAIVDWTEIAQRCRRLFGSGLNDNFENLNLVVLSPERWQLGTYDPLRQELTRAIFDRRGRILQLWLPFTKENESAVEFLERHNPDGATVVLGAIRLVAGCVRIQPISLLVQGHVISLNLEKALGNTKLAVAGNRQEITEEDDDTGIWEPRDGETADAIAVAGKTAIGRLLMAAQAEIEQMAESGTGVRRDLDLLNRAAARFEALGLSSCARPLLNLAKLLARSTTDPSAPMKPPETCCEPIIYCNWRPRRKPLPLLVRK